jgi:hypothetical protein
MEVWDSSRIPKTIVRPASPTVKPVEARLMLSCRCIYVIFFGPKGHFVMNKYLYYWTWNLVIILLLYLWFELPGHTYGGFVPSFSERGMTSRKSRCTSLEPPVVDQARRKEANAATPPRRNPEPQITQRKNPSHRRSVLSLIP